MKKEHFQNVMWLIALFFLLIGGGIRREAHGDSSLYIQQEPKRVTYAIAVTTIPPRFQHLTIPLLSWINQVYPPYRVCLYIPKAYKRFKRKDSSNISNNLKTLINQLSLNPQLDECLSKKRLKLVSVETDFGPITRFIGVLSEYASNRCFGRSEVLPDYWIIGDDDVAYSPYTILKYHNYITSYLSSSSFALTQFVESYRLFYYKKSTTNQQEQEESDKIIPRHLQAVDTYLIPNTILETNKIRNNNHLVLRYDLIIAIINRFHEELCPESFYQDDYIVSFLLSLAEVPVFSIWNNDKLTEHIENVSLSHFQMHRDDQVFFREEGTKACIFTYAPYFYNLFVES